MAVLVGTVIGLAKMQGDSELVAIRAAGVGNFQITLPIVLLGVALFTLCVPGQSRRRSDRRQACSPSGDKERGSIN